MSVKLVSKISNLHVVLIHQRYRRTDRRSAVLRLHVVRLSVCDRRTDGADEHRGVKIELLAKEEERSVA